MIQINQKLGEDILNHEFDAFQDEEIKKIKLGEYAGKWLILFFYPADFTFVCPTELEEMADTYPEFTKNNAEVLSVSTDTVYVHKAWHDQSPSIKKIKFPMLADPAGVLSRYFNVYLEDEGLALRGSFIIDPDGAVKICEKNNNDVGRNAKELLRKLEACIFVRKNGGEACPANWHPGEKALTKGLDLVGKL